MISAAKFAECALLPKWEKYTYDKLDCQAFVEAVLKEIGVRKPDGSVFDWRGSNSMFRNYPAKARTASSLRIASPTVFLTVLRQLSMNSALGSP